MLRKPTVNEWSMHYITDLHYLYNLYYELYKFSFGDPNNFINAVISEVAFEMDSSTVLFRDFISESGPSVSETKTHPASIKTSKTAEATGAATRG